MNLFKYKYILATLISFFYPSTYGYRVLGYHSIKEGKEDINSIFDVEFKEFKKQIEVLKERSINVISFGSAPPTKSKNVTITFDDGYLDNLELAAPILEQFNFPYIIFIVSDFVKYNKKGYLTKEALKELSNRKNVIIGSHCKTHTPLCLLSKEKQHRELKESKEFLEDIIKKEVNYMSFPHGSCDDELIKMAKEVGYKKLASSEWGNNLEEGAYILKRNTIMSLDNQMKFIQKVEGKWDWMKYLS